jgi:wyosine [tRNA(Phe)-imidazoG37] synthetase (radical SAM superfamily)
MIAFGKADWVSLKVDSVIEKTWRKINRPHRTLQLAAILGGMLRSRETYTGELATETMLVEEANNGDENLKEVAGFLARLKPDRAYLSILTRPPAEKHVYPPDEKVVNRAYQILSRQVNQGEYLIGYEGDALAMRRFAKRKDERDE